VTKSGFLRNDIGVQQLVRTQLDNMNGVYRVITSLGDLHRLLSGIGVVFSVIKAIFLDEASTWGLLCDCSVRGTAMYAKAIVPFFLVRYGANVLWCNN